MTHQDWQELIPFYVAQTLPPAQRENFEDHLEDCDTCQQEIDEWRTIASAVWSKADDAARSLPPLSQDVYNRLSYRGRSPRQQMSTPPRPSYADENESRRTGTPGASSDGRNVFMPVTLVAGFLVAVLFGGLILSQFAPLTNDLGEVALNVTPQGTPLRGSATAPFGSQGLIPTNTPPNANTSVVTPNASTGGGITQPQDTAVPPPAQSSNTPLPDSMAAQSVAGEGPHITQTPGQFDNGVARCWLFKPQDVEIVPIFDAPADDTTQIARAQQSVGYAVVSRTADGNWYEIALSNVQGYSRGWVPANSAYMYGTCNEVAPATPTGSASQPQQQRGPFITPSPGVMDGGAPLCYAVNPTTNPTQIPLFANPNRDAPPVAYVMPNARLRTIVQSPNGWYQVFSQEIQRTAWMSPDVAILEGNCTNLWTATPTPNATSVTPTPVTPTATPLQDDVNFERVPANTVAEVTASFVDLRQTTDRSTPSVAVAQRGDVLTAIGYSLPDNQWLHIRYSDGRELWAPADAFTVRPATGATPTFQAAP